MTSPEAAVAVAAHHRLAWHVVVPGVALPAGGPPTTLLLGRTSAGGALALAGVEDVPGSEATDWQLLAESEGGVNRLLNDLLGLGVLKPLPVGAPVASNVPLTPDVLTDLSLVSRAPRSVAPPPDAAHLAHELAREVRGQARAVNELALRAANHLARHAPRRPLTAFLVGPTGVGKTKAAETLARLLRAHDATFLRLDMSEYHEAHRISQLLGAPSGYVGYADGGALTDALAKSGRAIVLFDEIEKAHPAVLRVLMNAMDAGRLANPRGGRAGRELDCTMAIFLFTSNLAAEELALLPADLSPARREAACREALLRGGVAPELVGRIASFAVFEPLPEDVEAEITVLSIAAVAREYGLTVMRIDPEVVSLVLAETESADLGARPLEYTVDRLLGQAFAAARTLDSPIVEVVIGPPLRCVAIEPN